MANFILILVIALIVGVSITYIVKEKKKGNHCIGCPAAATCPGAHANKCSGGCQANRKEIK